MARYKCKDGTLKYQNEIVNKPGRKRKLSLLEEYFIVLVRLYVFTQFKWKIWRVCVTYFKNYYYMDNVFCIMSCHSIPFCFTKISEKVFTKKFWKIPNTNNYWWNLNFCWKSYLVTQAQTQTWSNHKHRNTWKALAGIFPNGILTFVSSLWTGRVS